MDINALQIQLEKRLEIIGDAELRGTNPELQLDQLKRVSESIDSWREQYREDMDKRLLHFLDNYSLDKALDFVKNNSRSKCS